VRCYCSQQSLLASPSDEMHAVSETGLFGTGDRMHHNLGRSPLLSQVSDACKAF
jgi:hypothetical protein